MKNLIYILIFLLIVSCKEDVSKANIDVLEYEIEDDKNNPVSNNNYTFSIIDKNFDHKELTAQKLQELYDLSSLKNTHPEFKRSIELQLKNFTKDSTLLSTLKDSVSIKNIEFITDNFETTNTSQKVKLRYDLIINNSVKKDSIIAEITSHKIILDDKEVVSNKIKFSKK